jgi:hypothetical protein
MRRMLASAVAVHATVALGLLAPGSAHAGLAGPGPGVTGNDTGGIIQWVPGIEHSYKEIAVAHCARWNRYAGISSVRHVYGDYIGFQCVFDRRYDPRKAGLPPPY